MDTSQLLTRAIKAGGQHYMCLDVGHGNIHMPFKMGIGADVKLLLVTTFGWLAPKSCTKCFKPSETKLAGYGGHEVPTIDNWLCASLGVTPIFLVIHRGHGSDYGLS